MPLASLTITPLASPGDVISPADTSSVDDERRRRVHRQRLCGQQLFEEVLAREAMRTLRSDSPLVVLTLAAADRVQLGGRAWNRIAAAVGAVVRETDMIGWRSTGAVLGVILTDTQPPDQCTKAEIERRVLRSIEREAGPEAPAQVVVSVGGGAFPSANTPRDGGRLGRYDAVKRVIDVVGSLVLLGLLSPLLCLIGILVKLKSPGPALFRQVRVGYGGKPFTMLKFRTMHVDVGDAIHQKFVHQLIEGTAKSDPTAEGTAFKIVDDPRTTRFGRFLRRTSLDELPQLWNVLIGDMSLVGPRPPLPYEVERYKSWHRARLSEARPGVTGLWQVAGRSRTTFDEMVRLDLRYARTRSLRTDLKILLETPRAVIEGKGAH